MSTFIRALVLCSSVLLGCAPKREAAPPPPASPSSAVRHVYRLDFVLTASDGTGAPKTTSFTLNLLEADRGEVRLGKNIPIAMGAPVGAGAPAMGVARQDVGLRVDAQYRTLGDDVLLEVSTELSASEPPEIRKVTMRGVALAAPGRSTVVTTVEDDRKRYELSVTPTRVR
jgi:hypothetical protein